MQSALNKSTFSIEESKDKKSSSSISTLKISLSKVRLHGSTEKLGSINDAKRALNDSGSKVLKLKSLSRDKNNNSATPLIMERQRRIGEISAPAIKISSAKNKKRRDFPAVDGSTYGLPVKAEVDLDIIRMIASKSSQNLAV